MNDQAEQAVENQNESAAKEPENEDRAPFEDDVLLEEMVRALVTYPEDVEVKQTIDGERKELMVYCNSDDVGKVIGKHGRVVNMINDFFGVIGFRNGYQVTVQVQGDTNFFRKNPGVRPPQQRHPAPYPPQQPPYYPPPQAYGYPPPGPPPQRHYRRQPQVEYQGRQNGGGFRRNND